MNENYYLWLIFIAIVLFALIGILIVKGPSLTGADVAEISTNTSNDQIQPSAEDELKKKQEFIEESFKNATTKAIKDVVFLSCVEVRLHKNLPKGALKGVVQKLLIKTNGKEETKIEGYPDKCSENGKKAIENYCSGKQVLQREKTCETRCIAGICA